LFGLAGMKKVFYAQTTIVLPCSPCLPVHYFWFIVVKQRKRQHGKRQTVQSTFRRLSCASKTEIDRNWMHQYGMIYSHEIPKRKLRSFNWINHRRKKAKKKKKGTKSRALSSLKPTHCRKHISLAFFFFFSSFFPCFHSAAVFCSDSMEDQNIRVNNNNNTYIFYSAIPRWASSTRLFTYMYIIYYINIY